MSTTTHDTIGLGALEVTYLLDAEQTDGACTSFVVAVAPQAKGPIAHSHDSFDEVVYGLQGTTTFTVGGVFHEVGPGVAVFVPRGAVHSFDNHADTRSSFLTVATPGVFRAEYFHDVAGVLRSAAGGPPDRAAMAAVMARHGITPAVG